jgi:ABC-type sugar transport system substrate-binding protein/AraC-like DNA-binding protein
MLIIVSVIMGLLMSSCRGRVYKIGVSQCSGGAWREKINNEMITSQYIYGNVRIDTANAFDSNEAQARQIDSLVASGIDLLVVAPNEYDSIAEHIENAYKKGIPVILFDRKSSASNYTAWIGGDNVAAGMAMGNLIATDLNGKGVVVELTGDTASSPVQERHKGFSQVMKAHKDIKFLTYNVKWDPEKAAKIVRSLLKQGEKIDAVFGHNDYVAMGAYNAAKEMGMEKHIKCYGIDGLNGKGHGLEAVRDGVLAGTYIYPTHGGEIIQLAINILEGKPYKKINSLSSIVVTKENVSDVITAEEELAYKQNQLRQLNDKLIHFFGLYDLLKVVLFILVILLILSVVLMLYGHKISKIKAKTNARLRHMAEEKIEVLTSANEQLQMPLKKISTLIDTMKSEENVVSKSKSYKELGANVQTLRDMVSDMMDYSSHKENISSSDRRFMNALRLAVNENMSNQHLKMDDLAAELGLSRVQVYRKVKQITGMTLVDFLRVSRLQRARMLLQTTDKTVAEVASSVGFSSPSYFTTCFKQHFGMYPNEVKNKPSDMKEGRES